MTTVAAAMARSYTADMFVDLTDVTHVRAFDKASGVTTLTFASDLDGPTVAAIRDRMTSRNDADQAARTALRDDRDALAAEDPLRRLYDYVLERP